MKKGNIPRRALIAVLGTVIALFSCTQQQSAREGRPFVILASFYPVYITALNIAKNVPGVLVKNMAGPQSGCLHDYQLSPGDMKKIYSASVFIINGIGMESFMDKVIKQIPDLKIIDASTDCELIHDPRTKIANPHVFTSISGTVSQAETIAARLAIIDPSHAALYRKNCKDYIAKLETLRINMLKTLAPLKGTEIITFHEAFPYFAREFGLVIKGTIEREPGTNPSGRELQDTIELIKKNRNILLFVEPQYPSKSARVIARETGIKIRTLDPAVTGPDDPDAYLNIMKKNLHVLSQTDLSP